jgi:divalent metal cation (Fe/Co/Zn/Cd) transporter
MNVPLSLERAMLVQRSRRLNVATMGYNSLEAVLSVLAGIVAGSVALIGFGLDSLIELIAGAAALWRLSADAAPSRRERTERRALLLIGLCFVALALYVGAEALRSLAAHRAPERTLFGIGIAVGSLLVMPWLARAKRGIALELGSGALAAEAKQTLICTYLSGILLGGLLLNAMLGWWWADPVAALAMVPLIGREGIEDLRGRHGCDDCVCQRGIVTGG